jgi:hypothetical protein
MNEDPTKPQGDDQYDTTPGVTAILERINQVRTELLQSDSGILERINQVHAELLQNGAALLERINQSDSATLDLIGEVRGEMLTRFNDIEGQVRLTNHKLDVVREDLFNAKVQVRDVQARVDELERKVS